MSSTKDLFRECDLMNLRKNATYNSSIVERSDYFKTPMEHGTYIKEKALRVFNAIWKLDHGVGTEDENVEQINEHIIDLVNMTRFAWEDLVRDRRLGQADLEPAELGDWAKDLMKDIESEKLVEALRDNPSIEVCICTDSDDKCENCIRRNMVHDVADCRNCGQGKESQDIKDSNGKVRIHSNQVGKLNEYWNCPCIKTPTQCHECFTTRSGIFVPHSAYCENCESHLSGRSVPLKPTMSCECLDGDLCARCKNDHHSSLCDRCGVDIC